MGVIELAQKVNLNPDPGQLPGGDVLQSLTNGIAGFALIFCLMGFVLSAGLLALGSHSNNYQQTFIGKRGLLVCLIGVVLISGAGPIINFFYHLGQGI